VAGLATILACVASCHKLRRLDVSHNTLPDHNLPPTNWVPVLAEQLPDSRLRSLYMSHCAVRDAAVSTLLPAVTQSHVRTLDLGHNSFGADAMRALAVSFSGEDSPFVSDLRCVTTSV